MSETKETTVSETKKSTFSVSDPFDSDPGADVVLVSCDNAEFRVRKAILSFASPVFSDMFSLPQTMPDEAHNGMMSPTTTGGLPFVHLSETGTVIDSLLRYIYPIDNPLNINAGFLCDVLDTAEKYDMKYIAREARLQLNRRRVTEPEALLVLYRRACDQLQEDDARRYAFETLTLSHPLIVKQWGAYNMVGALSNLIEYHQAVSMAISDYIARFWSSGSGSIMWGKCRHCNNNDCPWTSTEPSWWTNKLLSRVQNICKEGPLSAPLLPSDEAMEFIKCHSCSWSVYGKWKDFEAKFSKAINEEAKQIKLTLPWLKP